MKNVKMLVLVLILILTLAITQNISATGAVAVELNGVCVGYDDFGNRVHVFSIRGLTVQDTVVDIFSLDGSYQNLDLYVGGYDLNPVVFGVSSSLETIWLQAYYNSHPPVPFPNAIGVSSAVPCNVYEYLPDWESSGGVTYLTERALMLAPSFANANYVVQWAADNGGSGFVDGYPQTVSPYGDMTLVLPAGYLMDVNFNFIVDGQVILTVRGYDVLYSHPALEAR